MLLKILIAWLVFDLLVYCVMAFDVLYYRHDLPAMYRKILDTFTEDD